MARLEVERWAGAAADIDRAWSEARRSCPGDAAIWTWGLGRLSRETDQDGQVQASMEGGDDPMGPSGQSGETALLQVRLAPEGAGRMLIRCHTWRTLQRLLDESMAMQAEHGARSLGLMTVHQTLLIGYVRELYSASDHHMAPSAHVPDQPSARVVHRAPSNPVGDGSAGRLGRLMDIARRYLPDGDVWREVFRMETDGAILKRVYEHWRRRDGEEAEASVAWAAWLVRSGRGDEAREVVVRARSTLGEEEGARAELEARWRAVLDGEDQSELGDRVDGGS
jgi:U3 small nucleolar RNA-associated protein 6